MQPGGGLAPSGRVLLAPATYRMVTPKSGPEVRYVGLGAECGPRERLKEGVRRATTRRSSGAAADAARADELLRDGGGGGGAGSARRVLGGPRGGHADRRQGGEHGGGRLGSRGRRAHRLPDDGEPLLRPLLRRLSEGPRVQRPSEALARRLRPEVPGRLLAAPARRAAALPSRQHHGPGVHRRSHPRLGSAASVLERRERWMPSSPRTPPRSTRAPTAR